MSVLRFWAACDLENVAARPCAGKELLAYYTISQSAILIFLAVLVGLLMCLAWRVAHEVATMHLLPVYGV